DVAVDESLAGHPVAAREFSLGQVIALLVLDGVGVLEAFLDLAPAGAADAGAALERDAALLADRGAQQVAGLRDGDNLVLVGDEGDGDRHQSLTSSALSAPLPASCASSARALSRVANRGRNFDGTRFTT